MSIRPTRQRVPMIWDRPPPAIDIGPVDLRRRAETGILGNHAPAMPENDCQVTGGGLNTSMADR